jgi:hypothetical protein
MLSVLTGIKRSGMLGIVCKMLGWYLSNIMLIGGCSFCPRKE